MMWIKWNTVNYYIFAFFPLEKLYFVAIIYFPPWIIRKTSNHFDFNILLS
ncbi:hypothetical protein STW0522CIT19_17420 [Citrobacter freundii]|nr:hypothetical protein STW0522CIT01_17420 [Citrobacter freundii]BBV35267.1 hypothetical protein STW0522CIT19_17420 [Citrobacter freundii]